MFRKTQQFVKDHPTLTGCAVGIAVGYKFGHRNAIRGVLDLTNELAYHWGRENGILAVQNGVMLDFINQRGMADEMREFLRTLGDKTVEEMMR